MASSPPRRTVAPRILAGMIAALLTAGAVVIGTGAADAGGRDGLAGDVLALARMPVPVDVDPLAGVEIRYALPSDELDVTTPLPSPERPPADPYAPTPRVELGLLEIPAIGLAQPLFEGVTLTAINRGPSHWPGSAMPGEIGNVVVAGHRTTYTKPFWALNELVPGDELIFTVGGQRITYELVRTDIVNPSDIHIIDQSMAQTATLFACHPRGSAAQRIVAHFALAPERAAFEVYDSLGTAGPLNGL